MPSSLASRERITYLNFPRRCSRSRLFSQGASKMHATSQGSVRARDRIYARWARKVANILCTPCLPGPARRRCATFVLPAGRSICFRSDRSIFDVLPPFAVHSFPELGLNGSIFEMQLRFSELSFGQNSACVFSRINMFSRYASDLSVRPGNSGNH
jgi:hypothetical protein